MEEPVELVPKELTAEDFEKLKLQILISNLEEHTGTVFDAGLFPTNTDPKKMQTNYWLSYTFMGESVDLRDKMMNFESSTNDNG